MMLNSVSRGVNYPRSLVGVGFLSVSDPTIPARRSRSSVNSGMLRAASEVQRQFQDLDLDGESERVLTSRSKFKDRSNNLKPVSLSMPPTEVKVRKPRFGMNQMLGMDKIFDDPDVVIGYASVPILEVDLLPRGGISIETQAVGRIQFGIPPETIKDSMRLGIGVPGVYVVPPERFCREMGPALGINLAEFEFPAYFNFFVHNKPIILVVDSHDAESNIRRVFGETLLGPAQFRNHDKPKANEDEDFDPSFPVEARPNFYKEFYNFRTSEECTNYEELRIDMLLSFQHFTSKENPSAKDSSKRDKLGIPPPPPIKFLDMDEMGMPDNVDDSEYVDKEKKHQPIHTLPVDMEGQKDESATVPDKDQKDDSLNNSKSADTVEDKKMNGVENKDGDPKGKDKNESQKVCRMRRIVSNPDMALIKMNSYRSLTTNDIDTIGLVSENAHKAKRKTSMETCTSTDEKDKDAASWASGASSMLDSDDDDDEGENNNSWMYSQVKWLGDVCTVYPPSATAEDKESVMTARVEIFKMPGGTEYIIHDIDEKNHIIGKARFSGTVQVPDEIAVEGFLTEGDDNTEGSIWADDETSCGEDNEGMQASIPRAVVPPTFHPPSFGVTVLGNSHGFDKNGSVSGYVLWINGRGVMIDPPPYSSATLEREGIRPQMIMAIIITHCHADHDAGAFQKVMTGSRVAVITTPTIYKSFIRKYAALSGLSPVLLRHSHRHRPAIVGQPLKFQGATFHFTYTLHTIPCIAFKVEWRGRSMVFTGDHMNIPEQLDALEKKGVLAKERADDLRNLPLQDCDLLLHESGAPPIHTPLQVLLALPEHVKKRLYVVHTSALPKECELRVAPTGTAGTIRLDQLNPLLDSRDGRNTLLLKDAPSAVSAIESPSKTQKEERNMVSRDGSQINGKHIMVSQTDSKLTSDALDQSEITLQRVLNLTKPKRASKIPVSSLDDGGHMSLGEVGEHFAPIPADVFESYCPDNGCDSISIPPLVRLRPTCVSDAWFILNLLSAVPFLSSLSYANTMEVLELAQVEVVCANEVVLDADRRNDVLCVIWEGTCIERDTSENSSVSDSDPPERSVWHAGDWSGPISLQPEPALCGGCTHRGPVKDMIAVSAQGVKVIMVKMKDLHKILKNGSSLYRKYLEIIERRHDEDKSMKNMRSGSDSLLSQHSDNDCDNMLPRNPRLGHSTDNLLEVISCNSALRKLTALQKRHLESLAEGPRYFEAGQLIWHVGAQVEFSFLLMGGTAMFAQPPKQRSRFGCRRGSTGSISNSKNDLLSRFGGDCDPHVTQDKLLYVSPNSEYARLEVGLQLRVEEMETGIFERPKEKGAREERIRSARDRFANKVLARLYARNAYTPGLVFSRGHFLSDTSRMVSGSLAFKEERGSPISIDESQHHTSNVEHHFHSSNISAGPDGCVAMVFPRRSLISFLDAYPGVLLSLLGTQVVV